MYQIAHIKTNTECKYETQQNRSQFHYEQTFVGLVNAVVLWSIGQLNCHLL